MIRFLGSLGILAVLTAITVSCSTVPRISGPFSQLDCLDILHPGYEIQAILVVGHSAPDSEFILAIRSSSQSADYAVLTPQGVPLYSINCTVAGVEIERKTRVEGELHPNTLLMYLAAMYMSENQLEEQISQNWIYRSEDSTRNFLQKSSGQSMVIRYEGEPPWFSKVHLQDRSSQQALEMRIIGSPLVLSE